MELYNQPAITVLINQYEWIQINDLLIFMNHLRTLKANEDVNFYKWTCVPSRSNYTIT